MTSQRRKSPISKPVIDSVESQIEEVVEPVQQEEPYTPTGVIFLGEEDKRLLKKLNKHIVNKLGLGGNRSFKI